MNWASARSFAHMASSRFPLDDTGSCSDEVVLDLTDIPTHKIYIYIYINGSLHKKIHQHIHHHQNETTLKIKIGVIV